MLPEERSSVWYSPNQTDLPFYLSVTWMINNPVTEEWHEEEITHRAANRSKLEPARASGAADPWRSAAARHAVQSVHRARPCLVLPDLGMRAASQRTQTWTLFQSIAKSACPMLFTDPCAASFFHNPRSFLLFSILFLLLRQWAPGTHWLRPWSLFFFF